MEHPYEMLSHCSSMTSCLGYSNIIWGNIIQVNTHTHMWLISLLLTQICLSLAVHNLERIALSLCPSIMWTLTEPLPRFLLTSMLTSQQMQDMQGNSQQIVPYDDSLNLLDFSDGDNDGFDLLLCADSRPLTSLFQ